MWIPTQAALESVLSTQIWCKISHQNELRGGISFIADAERIVNIDSDNFVIVAKKFLALRRIRTRT